MNMSQLVIRIATFVILAMSATSLGFAQTQSDAEFASYQAELLGQAASSRQPASEVRLASAQETPQLVPTPNTTSSSTFNTGGAIPTLNTRELLFKLAAGVLLSVSLCVGIMVVGSKLTTKQLANRSATHFQVVDTMMLGQRCWIELIQVKGQYLVVSRDATGIGNMVALPTQFEEKLDEADKETLEFEKAAEALLAQKGVTGWKQTKQKR